MENKNKPIFVTVPSLSPIENYMEILKTAWDSRVLTHNGPLVQKLEKEVNNFLGLNSTIAVTNGTIALQLAIRALKLKGEIITTPFSWIATASAIKWEGCTPVFADIDIETFNLDPQKIEDAITENTVAIMPVHVFSNPCEIEAIERIAKKHNLKVIYDAAHAFAVNYNGKSILDYGDISCTSWHATKLFNTGEGGACFTKDQKLFDKMRRLRFFGHNEQKDIVDDGLNGKMTEVHAAIGLSNLPFIHEVMNRRKEIFNLYYEQLKSLDYIKFQKINELQYNYSYLPIVFKTEEQLLKVEDNLKKEQIFARRYFSPSLNTVKIVSPYTPMPNSESLATRILCIPSHNDLTNNDIDRIVKCIKM